MNEWSKCLSMKALLIQLSIVRAALGHVDIMRLLLNASCRTKDRGEVHGKPFHEAAEHCHRTVVKS